MNLDIKVCSSFMSILANKVENINEHLYLIEQLTFYLKGEQFQQLCLSIENAIK